MIVIRCMRCSGTIIPKYTGARRISLAASKMRQPQEKKQTPELKIQPHQDADYEDAYKIAEKALRYLKKNDDEAVMRLIRQNHDLDLSVTWNYLIRHKIDNGRLNAAYADFQNMKKRQHFPNAYTYTILLDGLSRLYERGGRDKLEKTVESLFKDRRLKPTIIHLNAVLKVCSQSKDLPLAYEMIERFREAGVDQQDVYTYDTLFLMVRNAISEKSDPWRRGEHKTVNEVVRAHLEDAKNIWKDVEAYWRSGKLEVDYRLLSSYVSVLQKGTEDDFRLAMSTLEEFCDLPPPASTDGSVADAVPKKGAIVKVNNSLFTTLLELAELIKDENLAEHYWQTAKAASYDALDAKTYEARLRSLINSRKPAKATALLDEMRNNGILLKASTIFLALQCHFTHQPDDLRNATKFLFKYAATQSGSPKTSLVSIPVISTFARFLKTSRNSEAVAEAFSYLQKLDWTAIAVSAQNVPHHKQRLRNCVKEIKHVSRSAVSKPVPLRNELQTKMTELQSVYFSDDLTSIEKRRTGTRPALHS